MRLWWMIVRNAEGGGGAAGGGAQGAGGVAAGAAQGGGAAGGAAGGTAGGGGAAGAAGGAGGAAAGGQAQGGAANGLLALAGKGGEGGPPPSGQAAQGAQGAQGQQGQQGQQAQSYFPQGLDERFRGATERETLDKIAADMSGRPKPPEKPDGYEFKASDDFAKRYGDLKNDPVLPIFGKVAHKLGLSQEQFSAAVNEFYAGMAEAGFIETPISVEGELAQLMPAAGDTQQKRADAVARLDAALTGAEALARRDGVSEAGRAMLRNMGTTAEGVKLLEWMTRGRGEHGLQGGGAGVTSGDTKDSLTALMKDERYDLRGPKGDLRFAADVDQRWQRLHGVR